MDVNYNKESTLNIVNTANLGTWHGDSRECEQGQIIYQCSLSNPTINMNEIGCHSNQDQHSNNQAFKAAEALAHTSPPVQISDNESPSVNISQTDNQFHNQPVRFTFANSQTIRLSLTSSSESSDSTGSKTTTWGEVRSGSPTKTKYGSSVEKSKNLNSPPLSSIKNKNERPMTSWKDISPTKSSSSSDLDHSNHSNKSGEFTNKLFRFANRMKDGTDSSNSSENDQGSHDQLNEYAKDNTNSSANQSEEHKCECKKSSMEDSPCNPVACNCSKNSHPCSSKMQNVFTNSASSLSENESLSPKKEKGTANSPEEVCDNDYYYEDDFTVQFDTNIRETSVTPIDSDPNTTILDFPNMVTGSYLCFNNGGSSNVSFNNSKASSNVSLNNIRSSHIIYDAIDKNQYDSEDLSGNSGSHNSTMEMSSSERDIMGSSDIIDFSDGPLFTPTPSHLLSTDSLDKNIRDKPDGNGSDMNGSNGSSEANLNVDCCPKKEEYFLSFDGSHSRVSGSETDISLSFTSHDSCPGHWVHSDSGTSHESGIHGNLQGFIHDRGNLLLSSNEGQEESSDSFHICFNKLSPLHKNNHYSARENLSGLVLKKLVPVRETLTENIESSEDENTRTSTTLTAGSKELSSTSPVLSPRKYGKPQPDSIAKIKGTSKKRLPKSENLFLVGVGKPEQILRKAAVHSHTLPRMKKLVSWKQLKSLASCKKGEKSSVSLPELNSSATTWQTVSAMKCRKLSEISESFHNKRHSASLLEFYQRMKSQSNPVSPESMNNLEQILWPNFIGQKAKMAEMSDSSNSSQEYGHCHCCNKGNANPINTDVNKAYTNKRIFDWLKMECSSSSKDSNRPSSLACQTGNIHECFNKETIISPQTVTLWGGTKTVGSQFPPATKDCGMQTLLNVDSNKHCGLISCAMKKDQALQTSDFEEEEILSLLSENFDDFSFLRSNEGIANDFLSCPEKLSLEKEFRRKICRSKSADGEYRQQLDQTSHSNLKDRTSTSMQDRTSRRTGGNIGRSKSAGRISSPFRRMGLSNFYTYQSLPDMTFLTSSVTLEKEESKESLFDPMKLDLPVPVTIAPKTELEKLNIYQQKTSPVCLHNKSSQCSEGQRLKVTHKTQTESGSSSSGIFTSSASSGTDPAFCECRSRSNNSPENDLERLIFYPPHTELKTKSSKLCNGSKRRAHSVPTHLSDCAKIIVKGEKYDEIHPQMSKGLKTCIGSQDKSAQSLKCKKSSKEQNSNENLYALEEEQTPVASPEELCNHGNSCHSNCCQALSGKHFDNIGEGKFVSEESEFTNSDFYNAIEKGKIMIIENDYYRGLSMGIDSTSSSGSSVPNSDRKPLKSCLRKKNRGLRSRSMSAADNFNLNFEELEEKVKNRHSYACDEVYIVSDENGQLMMYQADESAEPVMFYLGKDGECHMTEGKRNHFENFGSFPNFDLQVVDSIHGSDSSTERSEGSSNKRKSVSFASEVSFQSISPAISPKKPLVDTEDVGNCQDGGSDEQKEKEEGRKAEKDEKNSDKTVQEQGDLSSNDKSVNTKLGQESQGEGEGFSQDDQGSSSSSDTPPQDFQITMDTNDNIWPEDLMLEKIGLLASVSKASDALIAHFAKSTDTFDKLRLGNSSETPEIGDMVVTQLCPALTRVICNGLKHHLAGFQMFGQVTINVWKVVEASVEIVPQTRALCDLVGKVKQTAYLTSYQQRFDAFIFGLLNLRLLDFWIIYLRQKEIHLAKYYESDAILVHSDTTLKKHYDDLVTSIQPLAMLPFQLNSDFIRDKALTDSKLKSQDLIGSLDGSLSNKNTGCSKGIEPTNESLAETTSMLELTASKALSWLASATGSFPKRRSDLSDSRSKSFDSVKPMEESSTSVGVMSGSNSYPGDDKTHKLSDIQEERYKDAKLSRVDLDHIISPSQSIIKSSQGSQGSLSSLFSAVAAKLDYDKGTNSSSQTLNQSMTASATSLVSKLFQFGGNTGSKQTAYKKGVTEYNFEEEQRRESLKNQNETVGDTNVSVKTESNDSSVKDCEEKVAELTKQNEPSDKRNSKRVSFDIVNLFDKLLLPQNGRQETKPASRIPVPTNRWSWSFGSSKANTVAPSSAPTSSSSIKSPKTQIKSDTDIHKKEHFPKKAIQLGDKTRGTNAKSQKLDKCKTAPPPKPPRLVSSPSGSKKDTLLSETVTSRHLKREPKFNSGKSLGTL